MSVFSDRAKKIRAIDPNKILFDILSRKKTIEFILDLNRKDQLFLKGEDSQGVKLGDKSGGYSAVTIKKTIDKHGTTTLRYKKETSTKTIGGSPILFDSGDFFSTFKIVFGKDFFKITADPFKDQNNLFDDFGSNIVGLQEESVVKLIEFIRNDFIIQFKKEFTS